MTNMRMLSRAALASLLLGLTINPAAQANPVFQALHSSGEALANLAPTDQLGRPNAQLLAQSSELANQPWVPDQIRTAIQAAVEFYSTPADLNAAGLVNGGPKITQFYWPTIAGSCIDGTQTSVGTAIAVPGETVIPSPGAGPDETVFLFTALGTSPAAPGTHPMVVQWRNLNTGQHGEVALGNHGINPTGPATISATAPTGRGNIVALLKGSVHTTGEHPSTCTYAPTVALIEAP
nr:hypothetical protein [Corynebacterium caspium]